MAVMRDVDFLLAALTGDPLPMNRPVVYRYRSGALRARVIAALRDLVAQQGLELARVRPPLGLGYDHAAVLFGQLLLFDWPARTSTSPSPDTKKGRRTTEHQSHDTQKSRLTADTLNASLGLLSVSLDVPAIHFVKHGSKVDRHSGWNAVRHGALVIEEPVITRESLLPVLRYLGATTDLAPGADLFSQRGFVSSFAGLIDENVSLPEVIQAFEERVLLCTDPTTHHYNDLRYQRDVVGRQGRRVLLSHLRDLVALRREDDLVDLISAFDERRAERGWSAYRLVVELYKTAGRLIEPVRDRRPVRASARSRVAPHRVTEGAVLWAALLLAWEDTFTHGLREEEHGYRRGPDLIVPAFAGLGRDFLVREDRAKEGDPLEGRWSAIGRSLGRCGTDDAADLLAKTRSGLVRALDAALSRSDRERLEWFQHLHEGVSAACGRLDAKAVRDENREDDSENAKGELLPLDMNLPPAPLHKTFATVIGREHAVMGLARHARERTDGVDILLYGPAGVGKQELARSYARMVLCTQPSSNGAACCTCESCRAVERGEGGRIEVDGARPNIKTFTDQIVKRVQTGTLLARRYVFVIRNADRYPPEEFDKLLKLMEDSRRVSFVLLARKRDGVRLAGQSRCFDYRVRLLGREEAGRFVRGALTARGLECDEAVVTLLVDAGGGEPRRLLEHCETVTQIGPVGADKISERLGLRWVMDFVAAWPEITTSSPTDLTTLAQSPGKERTELVRRIRAVLHWISPLVMPAGRYVGDAVDPSLRQVDEGIRRSLVAEVIRQADREGATAEGFWIKLAETWMADRLSPGWWSALDADTPANA